MAQSRVCILPKVLENEAPNTFLRLPHPRLGTPALFLLAQDKLYEVQAVTPDIKGNRSWFVGDSIVQDGRLFILTPFDPLFVLLAILLAAQTPTVPGGKPRSLPYSELFEEASNLIKYPKDDEEEDDDDVTTAGADVIAFGHLPSVKQLVPELCDVQTISEDLSTYKLCPDKTALKLKGKVARLATTEIFSGSFPTLARSMANDCLDAESIDEQVKLQGMQSLAIDVLANYLPAPIEKALRGSYDLSLLRQHIDCLKASQIVQENAQKPKERSGDKKDSAALKGAKKKAPVVSRGVKELEKVSKRGMSKLTTFFAKKAA